MGLLLYLIVSIGNGKIYDLILRVFILVKINLYSIIRNILFIFIS